MTYTSLSEGTKTRFYKTVNDNNKIGEIARAHVWPRMTNLHLAKSTGT